MREPTDDDREDYRAELERLWDFVSDMIEGGRLTEAMIPDDYQALVSQMVNLTDLCESARDTSDDQT